MVFTLPLLFDLSSFNKNFRIIPGDNVKSLRLGFIPCITQRKMKPYCRVNEDDVIILLRSVTGRREDWKKYTRFKSLQRTNE